MPRLVSPSGVVVSVSDEKAERLAWRSYEKVAAELEPEQEKPAPRTRAKKTSK